MAKNCDEINHRNIGISVGSVNCESFRNLCTSFSIDDVPVILYFSGAGKPGLETALDDSSFDGVIGFVENVSNHPNTLETVRTEKVPRTSVGTPQTQTPANVQPLEEKVQPLESPISNHVQEESEVAEYETPYPRNYNVLKANLLNDITIAVRFALENDVFLGRETMEGEALKALMDWLDVLKMSFPGDNERLLVGVLQHSVLALPSMKSSSQKISSKDWDSLLADWPFAKSNKQWKACPVRKVKIHDNVEKEYIRGGYSCSLWLLFHTLSVSSITGGAPPLATARAIHGFVNNFFNCKECRNNFIKNNPNPDSMLLTSSYNSKSKGNALLLWLWNEHNTVSMRLLKENPTEHRSIFPSKYHCPTCRLEAEESRTDKAFFRSFFPKEKEILKAEEQKSWRLDHVIRMVTASYCFEDRVLACPHQGPRLESAWTNGMIFLFLLLFLGLGFAAAQLLGRRLNKKVH
eukprot:CAMPEP_0184005766 /NCGR_PEP_ID=MMETSP0954-20121128/254_1 /TAXON_ID=627963 /ORGANISM="Aplanochytrium sp, Strain PBS07" /LENGTH=463 /DNA_ID=CAMNT_0026284109 /DNA_START=345 /DNA_END=1737 /DNA_ORIENTATION=+